MTNHFYYKTFFTSSGKFIFQFLHTPMRLQILNRASVENEQKKSSHVLGAGKTVNAWSRHDRRRDLNGATSKSLVEHHRRMSKQLKFTVYDQISKLALYCQPLTKERFYFCSSLPMIAVRRGGPFRWKPPKEWG